MLVNQDFKGVPGQVLPRQIWPFPSDCAILDEWPERSREGAHDDRCRCSAGDFSGCADREIVDLATGGERKVLAPPAQVLARAGHIAAAALAVAATYGRLPPFSQAGETREDAANFDAPASP